MFSGLESLKLEPHAELTVEEDVPPEMDFDDIPLDIDDLLDDVMADKSKGGSPENAIPLTPDEDGNVHIEL